MGKTCEQHLPHYIPPNCTTWCKLKQNVTSEIDLPLHLEVISLYKDAESSNYNYLKLNDGVETVVEERSAARRCGSTAEAPGWRRRVPLDIQYRSHTSIQASQGIAIATKASVAMPFETHKNIMPVNTSKSYCISMML